MIFFLFPFYQPPSRASSSPSSSCVHVWGRGGRGILETPPLPLTVVIWSSALISIISISICLAVHSFYFSTFIFFLIVPSYLFFSFFFLSRFSRNMACSSTDSNLDYAPYYANPAQPIRIVQMGMTEGEKGLGASTTHGMPSLYPEQQQYGQGEGTGPTLFTFPEKASFGSYYGEGGMGRIEHPSATSLPSPSITGTIPTETTLHPSTSNLTAEGEGGMCRDGQDHVLAQESTWRRRVLPILLFPSRPLCGPRAQIRRGKRGQGRRCIKCKAILA